jgi:hypothetical protein
MCSTSHHISSTFTPICTSFFTPATYACSSDRFTPCQHCIGGWVGPTVGLSPVQDTTRNSSVFQAYSPSAQPIASRYTDWALADRTLNIRRETICCVGGVRLRPLGYSTCPRWQSRRWIENWQGKTKCSEKTCYRATMYMPVLRTEPGPPRWEAG